MNIFGEIFWGYEDFVNIFFFFFFLGGGGSSQNWTISMHFMAFS